MKRIIFSSFIVFTFFVLSSQSAKIDQYKNGIFHGETRSKYTSESYWGNAFLHIVNNQINRVDLYIIDKNVDEVFDQNYESHYKGNSTFINQCRYDWDGLNKYITQYNDKRDMNQVNAISGATWSYNLFKDSVKLALEKAKEK